MLALKSRSGGLRFLKVEVERLILTGCGADIFDGGFGYATDHQDHIVGTGLQGRIVVTPIRRGVDFADLVRIASLDANLRALERLACGISYDTAKRRFSFGMYFQD